MTKLIKRSSKKAGLPPGTLVHIGEKLTEKTRITVVEYDGRGFEEKELQDLETCYLSSPEPTVTWVNVVGIQQVEVLEKVGSCFVVHPLALEDILNTEQRPKVEDYGEDLFLVVKLLSYNEKKDEIESEQISLILRPNALLSFQEREGDDFAAVKERLRAGKGRLRKMGADYLAYTLLDIVVDQYFVVLEKLGERVEVLEGKLLADPGTATLQKIQKLKKEMLLLRKWIWPLREVISSLERGEFPGIRESTALDFPCRGVRDEFQTYARTGLAVGISSGSYPHGHHRDSHAYPVPAEEVAVRIAECGMRIAEFPPHPHPPPRGGREREGVNEGTRPLTIADWGIETTRTCYWLPVTRCSELIRRDKLQPGTSDE